MSLKNLLVNPDHPGLTLEQYRHLRTNIEFLRSTRHLHTVAVTSAAPETGKSLTVANLGLAYAAADVKVLIIDADLRRPAQHAAFNLDNRTGLSTILSRGVDPLDAIQSAGIPNLALLPAGPIPPNPTELVAGGRFERVIERLGERGELIVIDTPPLLSYSESAILAHAADGVVYVARAGQTSRRISLKAAEELRQAGANLIGTVLNDATQLSQIPYYG